MSSELAAQVKWLVDRAQVSDVLFAFARALDEKNWIGCRDCFVDGGFIELPDPAGNLTTLYKEAMLADVATGLGRFTATHHMSSNHQVTIEGDAATSHSYVQATHVRTTPTDHWSGGGWYDCEYVRTDAGWKFRRVRLTSIWVHGDPQGGAA